MQLGKIVSITCLTYIVYGITSVFQLGVFLPPLPIKPFLILFFVLVGIFFGYTKRISFSSYLLLVWLGLYSVNNIYFLELFFSTEQIISYEETVSVLISLATVIIFAINSGVLLTKVVLQDQRFGAFFLLLLGGLTFHFIDSSVVPFTILIIGWSILTYILDFQFKDKLPQLFHLYPILYGVAIIEFVELLTIYMG